MVGKAVGCGANWCAAGCDGDRCGAAAAGFGRLGGGIDDLRARLCARASPRLPQTSGKTTEPSSMAILHVPSPASSSTPSGPRQYTSGTTTSSCATAEGTFAHYASHTRNPPICAQRPCMAHGRPDAACGHCGYNPPPHVPSLVKRLEHIMALQWECLPLSPGPSRLDLRAPLLDPPKFLPSPFQDTRRP